MFRRDLLTKTTTRVSVDAGGGDPNSESFYPSISATGRYVAFGPRNLLVWNPGTGPGAASTTFALCPDCLAVTTGTHH